MTVAVLGGYGTFGRRLVLSLLDDGIAVLAVGRRKEALHALIQEVKATKPDAVIDGLVCDVEKNLQILWQHSGIQVVINTCGPFQLTDYAIADACIRQRIHYIDLADAREYVVGIQSLHQRAQQAGVLVVSGASTVPALSSAVLEHYREKFSCFDFVRYGISPGQLSPRGLATTRSILTYFGQPIRAHAYKNHRRYGWQNCYRQKYPELGYRWMANCDVPDLDLFPSRYNIARMQFSAGMESGLLHWGMWFCSWLARLRLPINWLKHDRRLLRMSHWFDRFGTDRGGMHMIIRGKDNAQKSIELQWFLLAKAGDGPQIPVVPALILAKKCLSTYSLPLVGASPCVGLVTLEEYQHALQQYAVTFKAQWKA